MRSNAEASLFVSHVCITLRPDYCRMWSRNRTQCTQHIDWSALLNFQMILVTENSNGRIKTDASLTTYETRKQGRMIKACFYSIDIHIASTRAVYMLQNDTSNEIVVARTESCLLQLSAVFLKSFYNIRWKLKNDIKIICRKLAVLLHPHYILTHLLRQYTT